MIPLRPILYAGARECDRQLLRRSNTLRRELPPDRLISGCTRYIPIPLDALGHIH
ncbi:MAG: hypothetical protein FD177_1101 [Desulfovibrionaceae bacterium]|nr:MAG: hypothetical protein FD177_1101 [Desulfovibrionaceae bacterium]